MGLLGVAWSNIIIGLVTAAVVGGLVRTKDYAYNRYLEYRFPVAGEYITTFEDEIDGEEVVATAPATLEQNGRSIAGRTVMPDDDREWVLDGEIAQGGYMNGIYYAVDPHDRGIGNFFLYVNHDRRMEGLWSGYDEVNEKITSGRYTFTPVLDSYEIEPAAAERIPAVVDIADNKLGRDYLTPELLRESLDADSPYFTRVAVTTGGFSEESSIAERLAERFIDRKRPDVDDAMMPTETRTAEVIGFCVGAVFDPDQLDAYLNVEREALPAGLQQASRVGVVRTVAVRDGFEGRGVGTTLVGDCIQTCLDEGVEALCAVGWEQDGEANVAGLLDHFDFEVGDTVEEYWREESHDRAYHCESCGEPPCTCSATLFVRYV